MLMKIVLPIILCFLSVQVHLSAQQEAMPFNCAHEIYESTLQQDAAYQTQLKAYNQAYRQSFSVISESKDEGEIFTLPTVIHVIQGGSKLETASDLTDAKITTVLQETNDLFKHTSGATFDNPYSGVDTEIEFCLAQTNPNGAITTGIIRYTEMISPADAEFYEFIQSTLWDVTQYNNIYVMSDFIEGYCSLYMSTFDASFFGINCFQAAIITHEMGHYLSLEHTFQDGCQNNNCLVDGDYVCDTPPKEKAGKNGASCNTPGNSCSTDEADTQERNPYRSSELGGMGDQADMLENYMDSTRDCWAAFTQGQKRRMRFNIKTRRLSQKNSLACTAPILPENPLCDATIVTCGNTYMGSTENSTFDIPDNIFLACGSGGLGAPNDFYVLTGSGSGVNISLCNAEYDTRIDVYSVPSGMCGVAPFTCVDGNDDYCDLQSNITFMAQEGYDYHVMVHGYSEGEPSTGKYTMEVDCLTNIDCSLPTNSECSISLNSTLTNSAEPLLVQTDLKQLVLTNGSNFCTSYGASPSCGPDGKIKDVWYRFKPDDTEPLLLKVQLIGEQPAQKLNFAVFDACDGQEIVCQSGEGAITTALLENLQEEKQYFIQVWSTEKMAGDFGIAVYKTFADSLHNNPLETMQHHLLAEQAITTFKSTQLQISPNPLQTKTTLSYYLPNTSTVSVQVFDLSRQLIMELHPASHKGWNTTSLQVSELVAGMYYVVLQTPQERLIKKIMIVE